MHRWRCLAVSALACVAVLQVQAQAAEHQSFLPLRRLAATPVEAGDPAAAKALETVPPEWIITNESAPGILARTATPQREILFTTIRLAPVKFEEPLDMIANFCYFVKKSGALPHLLIFTTDILTWHRLHKLGFPAYLDRAFPARPEYIFGEASRPAGTHNRVFDVEKHWWGWKILEQDFFAVYMDADAVPLKDPFLAFQDNLYDVQGLSDWDVPRIPIQEDALVQSCELYYLVPDKAVASGTMLREHWHIPDKKVQLFSINPCQSTGLWYLRPTPPAKAFMLALVHRLIHPATWHQWDQTAWNEVILPFLWGTGDSEQLAYRILPNENYINVRAIPDREKAGLPLDIVILHSGGTHGRNKALAYAARGFWHPELGKALADVPGGKLAHTHAARPAWSHARPKPPGAEVPALQHLTDFQFTAVVAVTSALLTAGLMLAVFRVAGRGRAGRAARAGGAAPWGLKAGGEALSPHPRSGKGAADP
uniref:Glycosyltransferase n=1 Tax=Auxenochlorella protothecoides TaxID=3075 RepID=A0A1D1ZNZ3_AUXPR